MIHVERGKLERRSPGSLERRSSVHFGGRRALKDLRPVFADFCVFFLFDLTKVLMDPLGNMQILA